MEFNIEVRRKQLENLNEYITSAQDKVESILNALNWTEDGLKKKDNLIPCPIDASHRFPITSVEQHVKTCSLHKQGYKNDDVFLSEPVNDPNYSISLSVHSKIEILSKAHETHPNFRAAWNGQDPDPKTSDRLVSTFSGDERLALYDYVIQSTSKPETPPEFNTNIPKQLNKDVPWTYEMQLEQERNVKRRHVKYKSVHTDHKSHKEVMREVIEGQMQEYRDWLQFKTENTNCHTPKDDSGEAAVPSGVSTHSESSRSTCVKADCDSESRHKDYDRHKKSDSYRHNGHRDKKHSEHHNGNKRKRSRERSRDRDRHRRKEKRNRSRSRSRDNSRHKERRKEYKK